MSKNLSKDIEFLHLDKEYVIKNVPYLQLDAYTEAFFEVNVTLNVTKIRELMIAGLLPFVVDYKEVEKELTEKKRPTEKPQLALSLHKSNSKTIIEHLDLTVKIYIILKKHNIHFLEDILTKKESELLSLKDFTDDHLSEVKRTISALGHALADESE